MKININLFYFIFLVLILFFLFLPCSNMIIPWNKYVNEDLGISLKYSRDLEILQSDNEISISDFPYRDYFYVPNERKKIEIKIEFTNNASNFSQIENRENNSLKHNKYVLIYFFDSKKIQVSVSLYKENLNMFNKIFYKYKYNRIIKSIKVLDMV